MTADPRRTLLFLITNNQILLAMKKRGFGAGRWNGVGGKIESGESIEQALIRECQEEITVTPLHYYQIALFQFYGGSTKQPWHMKVHVYFCTNWSGQPHETEEMAPKWFKTAEIPYTDMWQDDAIWLPQALEGNKLNGSFYFNENDEIIKHTLESGTSFI